MADQKTPLTLQTGIKEHTRDMTQYSLFMGGLNVKNAALAQYDPLKTGYARLFITKLPTFLNEYFSACGDMTKLRNFRHLLEFGFVGIDGIQNTTMEFDQVTGGYAGRSFEVATIAKDETNSITIKTYEFAGSPIREMCDMWISGVSDPNTGLGHYHGLVEGIGAHKVEYMAAHHTMEAFYVQTDPTGLSDKIEYACLLTNMMPKQVKKDHFNYESGSHPLVQVDIEFTTTKYESRNVNEIAKGLLEKNKILRNYLYFESNYTIQGDQLIVKTDTNPSQVGTYDRVKDIADWNAKGQ